MSKVLLVEDSIVESKKITSLLAKEGFSVFEVHSAEEAQLRLKQDRPDLILLDAVLPGQSGFELCRKLKNNPATNTIPIIICSSRNKDLDRTWGNMSGADAYITKPIDEINLVRTINQFII
ncbi:MAG: response regulator [Prochloraceae cyanobacterium]|nr:response regulator [Prochloraceae cyanobacterium]